MPIEINGLSGGAIPIRGNTGPAATEAKDAGAGGGARTAATDTVEITDRASNLQDLQRTISSLPVVDAKRVESMQAAMESGSYEVDATETADKLIEFEKSIG